MGFEASATQKEDGSWSVTMGGKTYTVQADSKEAAMAKVKSKMSGGGMNGGAEKKSDMAEVLGFSENFTDDQVIAEVSNLRNNQFSDEDRVALESLKYKDRVMYYMEVVNDYTVIPGTTKEKAEKLAAIEFAEGEYGVQERTSEWDAFQTAVDSAKVTDVLLAARPDENGSGPATQKIKAYAAANSVSEAVAVAHFAMNDIATFTEYDTEQTPA